jgi:hypothetical protein
MGAPPPQQGAGEVGELRAQVGYLSGQLGALVDFIRNGGTGQMPTPVQAPPVMNHPPPMAAQPAPYGVDAVADAVITKLIALGLLGRPGAGVAAPAPPPPVYAPPPTAPPTMAQQVRQGMGEIRQLATFLQEARTAHSVLGEALGIAGVPEGAEETPAAPLPAQDNTDMLPFQPVKIPGVDTVWAVDKETGGVSWQGILASNPKIAEKALEAVPKVLSFLEKMTTPQGRQQAVAQLAAAAREQQGTAGVPAPEQPQPATQQNGSTQGGGWHL